jgi:hypothetical protein
MPPTSTRPLWTSLPGTEPRFGARGGVERDAISARAKAALAAAKAKGKRLGNYKRIAEAKQRATAARGESMRPPSPSPRTSSTRARCRSA